MSRSRARRSKEIAPEPSRRSASDDSSPGPRSTLNCSIAPTILVLPRIPRRTIFALAQALERKKKAGVATWVMRKHSYVGALLPHAGYLMLITLRHTEEVIPVSRLDPPDGRRGGSKRTRSGR